MHLDLRQKYGLAYALLVVSTGLVVAFLRPDEAPGVAIMCISACLAAWVVSGASARRLRRSIGRLRQVADAIGAGDFGQRVPCRRGDDLAKLVHAFNRMADRLEQMARDDAELRERLMRSQRLAAIGELAATVAHEVNNPLDGIQNCTRIIRRDITNTEQVRRMLDLMDGGLYRIEMIVRRLLSFARDETMNLVPTRLADVVEDALMFVQPRLEKHRIELRRHGCDPAVFALADRTQLAQALINLLLNAVDSTEPGGRIEIAVRPPPGPDDPWVTLVVEDNGHGIAPEHVPHIFEPFFSTKGAGYGTGLGLAVVRKIVEAHRGRIDVRTRLGHGTRFEIALPAAQAGALHPHGSGRAAVQACVPTTQSHGR